MLRCGCCEVICESYEDWLSHLVSPEHQANFGVNETFTNQSKDPDRNERSILVSKLNPTFQPYDVICHFASIEPLGFITDAFVHMFQNVSEKFYLIVYDQRKFVDRILHLQEKCGEQKVLSAIVKVEKKRTEKIQGSFFYRRHEHIQRKLNELSWDNQLSSLLKQVTLNQEGYTAREKVIEELEGLIREGEEFKDAIVHPFGSCTTWLADINADLDIYVDTAGDGGRMDRDRDLKCEIMSKMARIVRKKYGGENVFAIKHARVPIVVLSHPSGLKIDLSFENILSVQNSHMIRLLTRFDYRIRPLLIFLKYWARFHNLIGSQSIKSYALILMTFVYLRKLKLIPSVHELQTVEGTKNLSVCGWNAGFCQSRGCTIRQYTWLKSRREGDPAGLGQEVIKLAHGFFKEYSELDYNSQVICPLVGGFLPKVLFQSPNGANLAKEFQLYKANLSTGECSPITVDRPLCIQDPFALNVNVTAACKNQDVLITFKVGCAMAVEVLQPYVSTYDSCGTVNILELCCQPVPNCRKEEEKKKVYGDTRAAEESEECTTDPTFKTEPMDFDLLNDDNDNIWERAVKATRRSRAAEDKPEELVQNWSSATRMSSGSRCGRKERDMRDARVARVHLFDEHEPMYVSGHGGKEDAEEDDEEFNNGKAMKSVVVVPNQSIKTETAASSGGAMNMRRISETDYTRKGTELKNIIVYVGDNIMMKDDVLDLNDDSRKQKATTPGSSQSKVSGKPSKAKNHPPSSPSPVVKFLSTPELSLHLHKLPPPQVKFVQRDEKRSLSSLLVPYSDFDVDEVSVKNEEEETTEEPEGPVTTETPPAQVLPENNSYGYERTVVHSPKQPNGVSTSTKVKVAQSIYVPPKARTAPIPESATETTKRNVTTATKSNETSSIPIPSASAEVDPPPSLNRNEEVLQDFTVRVVEKQPKTTKAPKPSKPSEADVDIEFPRFGCYMSDEFIDQFYEIVGPIVSSANAEVVETKMKIIWVCIITDLFNDQNFWGKLSVVSEELEGLKLDKNQVSELQQHVIGDYRYAMINCDNRKRSGFYSSSEDAGSEAARCKVMKTSVNSDITSNRGTAETEFPTKYTILARDQIWAHITKTPSHQRKSNAVTYFLKCYPRKIQALYSQFMKISSQLKPQASNKQGPVDIFGKLCANVQSAVVPEAGEEPCDLQIILLFETGSESPVLYFGFPKLPRCDEDDEDRDSNNIDVNSLLEAIIKEIVPAYMDYRLQRFFK
ncbi:Speckle targeted PIP5K1A-regulated poly(A) polymerase [Orchesella cincta]|uniref:Speckle targeted PIP5K1A-regulated poly(A) polymerase n=1 Tax=Orchesella cincta TaxID=48709 RepID=A0A1D2NFD2_ORCCI|nr:Speckle targeted PIP5K1A-regulated poly(A) polymerase [Orchesella cincta]